MPSNASTPGVAAAKPLQLWAPRDPDSTPISQYRFRVNKKFNLSLSSSPELHRWSVERPHDFWIDLYDYCNILPALPSNTKYAYNPKTKLRDVPTFFAGHKLNFAENVLAQNAATNPDAIAVTGLREGKLDRPEHITWSELLELVRIAQSALVSRGCKESDVVAVLMANSVWTMVLFFATVSLGAIFTSVSPDMGAGGCITRFSQVKPKFLFVDMDLAVRGTRQSMLGKVRDIKQTLSKRNIKPDTVLVPTCPEAHKYHPAGDYGSLGTTLKVFISASRPSDELIFKRVPTSHPLAILYSSGTTGEPKCIVQPHISILNFKKIAYLNNSLGSNSTLFQYASTSWVVWYVMIGNFSVGAKTILYDGGALWPTPATIIRICQDYKATFWGTSPRYLLELEQSAVDPHSFDLNSLAMVYCTGATLTGPQMRWFYSCFPKNVHLASVAGGTDIASSWISPDPAGPLYENEMQMWALGHHCDIVDPETCESIAHTDTPGELVCWKPLPSMPCKFWNDLGNRKYHEAYFERFPLPSKNAKGEQEYVDVWAQHDFTVRNPLTGGLQILGRSDGVLNPSGVRFGSSEVYTIVEAPPFNTLLSDTLCVGRRRKFDRDENVFLFVIPSKSQGRLTPELTTQIKQAIAHGLSPRHVPKFIFEVKEIPYTINGKKVEIAVKKIISGLDVKISSSVINPLCLEEYMRFRDVERVFNVRERADAKAKL